MTDAHFLDCIPAGALSAPAGEVGSGRVPELERRKAGRYPCAQEVFCQPGVGKLDELWWLARVRNLSTGGLRLEASRRFDVGTTLAIELQDPAQDCCCTLQARVVYLRPQGGRWILGCAFLDPLSPAQLQNILREETPALWGLLVPSANRD